MVQHFVFLKVNNGLFFFSCSSVFLLQFFPQIAQQRSSLYSQAHQVINPMGFFQQYSSGTLLPSSSLNWTGCSLGLSHRCHSGIMLYHCLQNSLPLFPGFFYFVDPRSSSFIIYFCVLMECLLHQRPLLFISWF